MIALLKDAQNGGTNIPLSHPEDDWLEEREFYRSIEGKLNEHNVPYEHQVKLGAYNFLGSFSASGFHKGYGRDKGSRHHYADCYRNLMRQSQELEFKNIIFDIKDFRELDPKNFDESYLLYCDPPL